jgi:hypothetical protein
VSDKLIVQNLPLWSSNWERTFFGTFYFMHEVLIKMISCNQARDRFMNIYFYNFLQKKLIIISFGRSWPGNIKKGTCGGFMPLLASIFKEFGF